MTPRAIAPLTRESISAPEHPYTDRDVREDPVCLEFAMAYAATYQGSFGPMRDAQHELLNTGTLSTRTARVVLNCARNDARVQGRLPVPQYAAPAVPWRPASTVTRPALSLVPPLPPRAHEDVRRRYPVEIRRPIKIKTPFAVGRAAKYVHLTVAEHERNEAVWRIKGMERMVRGRAAGFMLLAEDPQRVLVSVSVKTVCRHPSVLHEAELGTVADLERMLTVPRYIEVGPQDRVPAVLCPRCLDLKKEKE